MPLRCIDPRANNHLRAVDLSLSAWKQLEAENRRLRHLGNAVLSISRGPQDFATWHSFFRAWQ
jgi:hypothetical protein